MKETQFIQQNRDKWLHFEQVLADKDSRPDELHDVYVQITDDLSHARTFYPTRSVRAYLNGLAQVTFAGIFRHKKSPFKKIKLFFTDDLPQVVYHSRWSFFWAVVFFVISFAIGYMSSAYDESFLRIILGDGYVDMTVENIKKGDPMAVYKSSGRFDMTFGIMLNNILVTLQYFILGVLAGIGSVAMMMYNGVMLGSFLQFFARYNLLGEANLTVWMHGVLEISAIVIGTAAGITMGRGLLFPGTYTRLQAFQMASRRAIKIMVGVVLMLVVAALIEGNLTRHTGAGDLFRGVFIAVCLLFVLFYYGWYPFYKAKKGFATPFKEAQLPPDKSEFISYREIKSPGEIFADTFLFFRRHMQPFLWFAAVAATVFCFLVFAFSTTEPDGTFKTQSSFFDQFTVIRQFFLNENVPFLPYINGILYGTVALFVFLKILKDEAVAQFTRREKMYALLKLTAIASIMMLLASMSPMLTFLIFFLVLPFWSLWSYLCLRDKFSIVEGIKHAWWLIGTSYSITLGTHYLILLIGYFIFMFVNSFFVMFYLWFIGWNLSFLSDPHLDQSAVILTSWFASFCIVIIAQLIFIAFGFLYYTLLEINEANNLFARIKQVGMSRKIQGIARE